MKPPFRLQTASLLDDPEVFGRDKDKEELMKFLLGDIAEGTGIPVIAIVGFHGVGKTALAQLLYNDPGPGVMERFGEFRAWAHISEDSDVFKITIKNNFLVSQFDGLQCHRSQCSSSQTKDEIEREEISVCLR